MQEAIAAAPATSEMQARMLAVSERATQLANAANEKRHRILYQASQGLNKSMHGSLGEPIRDALTGIAQIGEVGRAKSAVSTKIEGIRAERLQDTLDRRFTGLQTKEGLTPEQTALGFDLDIANKQFQASSLTEQRSQIAAALKEPNFKDKEIWQKRSEEIDQFLGLDSNGNPLPDNSGLLGSIRQLQEARKKRFADMHPPHSEPANQVGAFVRNLFHGQENIPPQIVKAIEENPLGYFMSNLSRVKIDAGGNVGQALIDRFGDRITPKQRMQLQDMLESAKKGDSKFLKKLDKLKNITMTLAIILALLALIYSGIFGGGQR